MLRNKSGPKPKPAHDRFLAKVEKTSGCWFWQGTKNNHGYGMFMLESPDKILAHRASWILAGRSITANDRLMHTCDVPSCVNPEHLRIGTQADNMRDMASKGRSCNQHAALSREQAEKALNAYYAGDSQVELARQFGVSQSYISCIVRGEIAKFGGQPIARAPRPARIPKPRVREGVKLAASDIPKIRDLSDDGFSQQDIATYFGVSKSLVQRIIAGRAWAHIS